MPTRPRPVAADPATAPRFASEVRGLTSARAVARLSTLLGLSPLPVQWKIWELLTEQDPAGRLRNSTAVLSIPRRGCKTESVAAYLIWRCLRADGTRCWVTAQSGQDVRVMLLELMDRLDRSPLAPRVKLYRGSAERVEFSNGSSIRTFAPRPDSLHGRAGDVVVVDECWSISEVKGAALLTAAVPVLATSREPALILASAAGTEQSTWWRSWVQRLHAGEVPGLDYGLPVDAEPTLEAIAAHHPAVPDLVTVAALRAAAGSMSAADFRRSFGNVTSSSTSAAVPPDAWAACAIAGEFESGTAYSMGFDVDVGRDHAAIAVAGPLPGGKIAVEILTSRPGAGWLAPQLEGMLTRAVADPQLLGIGCDGGGPAAGIMDQLAAMNVTGFRSESSPGGLLVRFTTPTWAAGCAGLFDLIQAGTVRHRAQADLDAAVAAATRRAVGDRWVWQRRSGVVPVSPLTAATAAVAVLVESLRARSAGTPSIY